jgi:hypothetical protein
MKAADEADDIIVKQVTSESVSIFGQAVDVSVKEVPYIPGNANLLFIFV